MSGRAAGRAAALPVALWALAALLTAAAQTSAARCPTPDETARAVAEARDRELLDALAAASAAAGPRR